MSIIILMKYSVPFFIAKRYLFSKKGISLVSVLSKLSIGALALITASTIILLSAFNGLSKLVLDSFNSYEPHLSITHKGAKHFPVAEILLAKISQTVPVEKVFFVLEDEVLVKYGKTQSIYKIKGVENSYLSREIIQESILRGKERINPNNFILLGLDIAYKLGIDYNSNQKIEVMAPKVGTDEDISKTSFESAFFTPQAIYNFDSDIDARIIFISKKSAEKLLNKSSSHATRVEVLLNGENHNLEKEKRKLVNVIGKEYSVTTMYEANDTVYKVMKNEKLAIIAIITILIILTSFNVIGGTVALILEKRDNLMHLNILGLEVSGLRRIVFFTSFFKFLWAGIIGTAIGVTIYFLQIYFELLVLNPTSPEFRKPYPVFLTFWDVTQIFFLFLAIGTFISWIPIRMLRFNRT